MEEMFECEVTTTKRGGYMLRGKSKNGDNMCKMLGKATAEEYIKKGWAKQKAE